MLSNRPWSPTLWLAAAGAAAVFAACSSSSTPEAGQAIQAMSCVYSNPFSRAQECREYSGKGWTEVSAAEDCGGQQESSFQGDRGCEYADTLGVCLIEEGTDLAYEIVFPGDDPSGCASSRTGCEVFAKGRFVEGNTCEGLTTENPGTTGEGVYQPATLECVEPLAGEPAGQSAGGKVCTFSSIAGCTEEGRRFVDYSTCDPVYTQRPYWPGAVSGFETDAADPILQDPTYLGELAWVKKQVESCGCVCCHSDAAPSGPSNWSIEVGPVFTDTFYPTGLALAAGWVDSSALGAYPPEDNNGFSRDVSGLPSTDPARMVAFFEGELARRGYTKADLADTEPFGGPLYEQGLYTPSACEEGEGVTADGKVVWSGGGARYVYVLEAGAKNPGAPPNLDVPEGTLWKLDVSPAANPLTPGLPYGAKPPGTHQAFPASGQPAALVAGTQYYVYVLADIGIPITRCLFTYAQ